MTEEKQPTRAAFADACFKLAHLEVDVPPLSLHNSSFRIGPSICSTLQIVALVTTTQYAPYCCIGDFQASAAVLFRETGVRPDTREETRAMSRDRE